MIVSSPRHSPRTAAKRHLDHASTTVLTKRHRVNTTFIESTVCHFRLLTVLALIVIVGHISLGYNLYVMSRVQNNETPADSSGSTLIRLGTVETHGVWNHKTIGNIWKHRDNQEAVVRTPERMRNQRRSLSYLGDSHPVHSSTQMTHVLEKEMSGYTLKDFEVTHKKNRQEDIPSDWATGVLSEKPVSFFRDIQRRIDGEDPASRCARYEGMSLPYSSGKQKSRRIFFGSLIASEPWELVEIVSTEAYGIFEGIVLVESNRTQTFQPRKFQRLHHTNALQKAFGTSQVQVRAYVNEQHQISSMTREHLQREEILKGWKEMGMGPDDIGYVGDLDETFTRDFLRAVQTCHVDILDYETHQCENAKILSDARVFEGSPECISEKGWWHPEMVIGACVQGIGDEVKHPIPANREEDVLHTGKGWGLNCDYSGMQRNSTLWENRMFPLYDGADFRRRCGTRIRQTRQQAFTSSSTSLSSSLASRHTAYHFHNWFADVHSIRHKYATYGHAQKSASQKRAKDFTADTAMMHQCALGSAERLANQKYGYVLARSNSKTFGGGDATIEQHAELDLFTPIYFQDAEYMKKRHDFLKYMIYWDEAVGPGAALTANWDHSKTKKFDQLKKRLLRAKEGMLAGK